MEKEKITAKYLIGQKVWFMSNNKASQMKITAIVYVLGKFQYFMNKYDYGQRISCNQGFSEDEIFATKEELLKSL